MSILILLNRQPYDGTDVVWNALRLAEQLAKKNQAFRIFLKNDAVDLARETCLPPVGYDQDLKSMLKGVIARGVSVEVCQTCMARCGVHKNEPYYEGAVPSTMDRLADLVIAADKILTY